MNNLLKGKPMDQPNDYRENFLQELKMIKANPHCKSCGGRGYLGIKIEKDQTKQLVYCYCAKTGMEDTIFAELFARLKNLEEAFLLLGQQGLSLTDKISESNKIHSNNTKLLDEGLAKIDRHTAGYWIMRLMKKFVKKEKLA